MSLHVSQHATWSSILERVSRATPAAFDGDRLRNLHEGRWQDSGEPSPIVTAVDQSTIAQLPKLTARRR